MPVRLLRVARYCVAFALPLALFGCLSSGDGSDTGPSALFESPVFTEMGGTPTSLMWGDFNGDDKVDVVFTLSGGNAFTMLGTGDGTFESAHAIGGLTAIYAVAIGDLNGDGKLDLAVTGCPMPACPASGAWLFIILGNGDGTFQAPIVYPSSSSAVALAIGDFNGDGHLDVAVGHEQQPLSVVSVLLGNGDGTLKAPTDWPTHEFAGLPTSATALAVADMNADGKQDLLIFQVAGFAFSDFTVLIGNGDGTFDAPLVQGLTEYLGQPTIIDFNHDGKLDVAISGSQRFPGGPGRLTILPGKGDGTFGSPTSPAYPPVYDTATFAVGDLDRDGNPDLAVRAGVTTDLSILYGKSDGTFLATQSFPLSLTGSVDRLIDLNGDGRPDLVLITATGIAILLNTH